MTVGLAADSVKFTALKSTSLAVGKSVSLKASAYREDGQKPVSTSVSYRIIEGEEFDEIDGRGKLTGIAVGTVVVAADAEQSLNNAYETITINVCIPATSVKLSESKYSLVVGGKPLELEATVLPLNNTDTLIWESSNEAVAAVDENGIVTAVGKGSAKIYAKTGSGKSAYCTVSVGIPADAVKFSSVKATSLAAGKSMMLKASAYRLDGQKPVSTSVIYEIVKGGQHAEISSSGKLTAISVGSVTVRAYAQSSLNDAYDEITIDVVVPITSLKFAFSSSALALEYGGRDFSALLTVAPLDNTDKITWESSDEDVAVVDENGFVTPVSAGKTKIYARSGSGKSAYCTVNVGLAADMIDISGCTKTVAVGKTLTLKGTASRLDGKKPISTALIWESDDESIVSVTPQGKLTAGSVPGIVTITARAEAGDVCESFLLTVTPLMYKLTADAVETAVGESFDLYKALHAYEKDGEEISLEDYCDVTFTCSSAYAKVENGTLIGIKEGRVTVKASVKCAGVSKSAYIYVTVVKPDEAQIEAELACDDSHATESETPEIAKTPGIFENSDNAETEEVYELTEKIQTESGAEQISVAVQSNTDDGAQAEESAESVEQSE